MTLDEHPGLASPMALRGFLEASPDAIIVADIDGRIVVVNGLIERMFGYSREELRGPRARGLPRRPRRDIAGLIALVQLRARSI